MPYLGLRSVPQKEVQPGLFQVPTVAADLVTIDAWIFQISVTNVTAAPITMTVKDKQGTPRALLNAESIPANKNVIFNYPEGVKMISGINWVAGGVGLESEVFAVKTG